MLQERWRLNIELGRHNSISTVTQPLMRRKLRGFSVESLPTFAEACGTFVGTRARVGGRVVGVKHRVQARAGARSPLFTQLDDVNRTDVVLVGSESSGLLGIFVLVVLALLVALEVVGAGVPVDVPVMRVAVQFSLVNDVLDAFALMLLGTIMALPVSGGVVRVAVVRRGSAAPSPAKPRGLGGRSELLALLLQ